MQHLARNVGAVFAGLMLVACGESTDTPTPSPSLSPSQRTDGPAVDEAANPIDASPTEIVWEPDLATAQARAAETGRPVLAYFTFDT